MGLRVLVGITAISCAALPGGTAMAHIDPPGSDPGPSVNPPPSAVPTYGADDAQATPAPPAQTLAGPALGKLPSAGESAGQRHADTNSSSATGKASDRSAAATPVVATAPAVPAARRVESSSGDKVGASPGSKADASPGDKRASSRSRRGNLRTSGAVAASAAGEEHSRSGGPIVLVVLVCGIVALLSAVGATFVRRRRGPDVSTVEPDGRAPLDPISAELYEIIADAGGASSISKASEETRALERQP